MVSWNWLLCDSWVGNLSPVPRTTKRMEESEATKANKLYAEGKYSAAIDSYTKVIEAAPNSVTLYWCGSFFSKFSTLTAPFLYQATYLIHSNSNRASAYYQMELYRRCISDCTTAIKLDAGCLRAYLLKGTIKVFTSALVVLFHDHLLITHRQSFCRAK